MFKRILLTLPVLVFGLGAPMLLPIADNGLGLSPITSAWAAPNCDADGDTYFKSNRKCGGNDPDDSDPCIVPDGEPVLDPSCGGGGTGTGGDLGSAISMDCMLAGEWGDDSGETISGDLLDADSEIGGTKYSDAVDKAGCSIDGPSIPWALYFGVGIKGRPENSVRKVEVDFGSFELPTGFTLLEGVDAGRVGSSDDLSDYPSLFEMAAGDSANEGFPDMDEMEPIRLAVRPYRDDPAQTEDGIHLLPWSATPYKMGMGFSFPGTERFRFSIASQHYPGNESFTGISCETGFEEQILNNAPDGEGGVTEMQDVSVYLWLDGDDADNLPDGYTISTGEIIPLKDANENYLEGPPDVDSASLYAAVCSSVGPDVCGNPRAPSNCNFLGYVPVQFTMHARVK